MTTKETKSLNIHQAMLKFHKEFHGAQKTGVNEFFKKNGKGSVHFTLDDIVNATTPVLQKCGLYVIHQVSGGMLNTSVCNADGENITSAIPMAPNTNPQVTGGLMTYFKRYNLCNLLNIAEADDDGNFAAEAADLAAEIERQKEKEIKPKPPVTDKQRELLNKHLDAFKMNPAATREARQLEVYLKSDTFTEEHARNILKQFKENGV
jgi:hypothetical protein